MTDQMSEDPLHQAERHVIEGERRVTAQIERIARMKADGDSERAIAAGQTLLAAFQAGSNETPGWYA